LGHPSKFQRVSRLGFLLHRRRSPEINQTLHDVWPSPGLVQCMRFGGCCLTEFCQVQNSLCVHDLRAPILAALLHSTRAVGVSQTSRRRTSNGITELLLLVIFNKWHRLYSQGAIVLGVGPHSSLFLFLYFKFILHFSTPGHQPRIVHITAGFHTEIQRSVEVRLVIYSKRHYKKSAL